MSIKTKIIKVGICSVMVMVPLSQVSLPGFAAEEVGVEAGQDIVNIPDPVLKRKLNYYLEQAPDADITEAQMARIKNPIFSKGITDLTGIEYLKNVEELYLSDLDVPSYEPIKSLASLKILYLNGEKVTSDKLPDFSGLTNLTLLDMSSSSLDNAALSKINNLPNLTKLYINYNLGITKLSDLKNLPKLQELYANDCQIEDFRGIGQFPSLTKFYGNMQRFGFETDEFITIKSSQLTFNASKQTLFVPFSIIPKTTILNYDGTPLPFSTSPEYTDIGLANQSYVVTDDKKTINQQGITLSGFSQAAFDSLDIFDFITVFESENIARPSSLANGTYNLKDIGTIGTFRVDHSVNITAEDNISYIQGDAATSEKFLTDIKANANGATITSDIAEKVNFSKPGTYKVTLNAENTVGLKGEPIQVTVTIIEKTVITAESEVSYNINATKSEAAFLADIKAATNDGTAITTDFTTVVDLTKAGEYTVTLNAENDKQKATPLKVTVKVKDAIPVPDPKPTPDPDPSIDSEKDPSDFSDSAQEPSASTGVKKSSDPILLLSASPKSTLPKTGDSLPATGVVAGFLVLGLGVLIARKK